MAETGSFELKKKFSGFDELFKSSAPVNDGKAPDVKRLRLDALHPYKEHPFKPYSGRRFDDMIQSVRDNGVIMPIIVRSLLAGGYEILSGHNRVAAAKAAGIEAITAIVREGLSDEDALLIVTETNLIQRSFADMSHSERAVTLTMHHEAIKKQGKRTDLIAEIENMLKASAGAENLTSAPMEQKLNAREKTAQSYDLGKETVARYIRINRLITPHKERLDNGELAIRAAVTLSYLSADEQQAVDDILTSSSYKIDMKKAESLRAASDKKPLDHAAIEEILSGAKKPKPVRHVDFKLKTKIITRFFGTERKTQEIEDTITRALEYYFAHANKEETDDSSDSDRVVIGDSETDNDDKREIV